MRHDKKPDVGYYPTDMDMTEREYEEFVKEINKSGVQKFGEDYGMVALFLVGIGVVVMLFLSLFSGNAKEIPKTYNDILFDIYPKFEYLDSSKVEESDYDYFYEKYCENNPKESENKSAIARFVENMAMDFNDTSVDKTAVCIKATMEMSKDDIVLRYLDDNRQLVKLTLKKDSLKTYYGYGEPFIILKSNGKIEEKDIDSCLKNNLEEFEVEFYLTNPIE